MAGRASIVGAAETSVGKVRDHNEDAHFIDPEAGIFLVCDGMGGHAAGEVASALAVKTIRGTWSSNSTQQVCDRWLAQGTPEARKQLLQTVQAGVLAAHNAIVAEAEEDRTKKGMGTTLVGAIVVGGDIVFAHAGDSRAYMVRDGIAMQLTEDHTLLARLLAAGVDVDVDGEGMRFKSMLTNALGIGHECKVSTFVVPVADGDRFLLCSDGITEYVKENEIGEVLTTQPSPARSAQRLVELALARGGGDNATALVVRVLEAGETARPAAQRKREEQAINMCPIWGKANPQQRLRALRIALPREYAMNEKLPAQTLGDRVAWIIVEGELEQGGVLRGPGALMYPEALLVDRPLPDKDGLAITQSEVRALALRSDDFRELCDDDPELGEILLSALASEINARRAKRHTGRMVIQADALDGRGTTDPADLAHADTAQHAVIKNDADLAYASTGQMSVVKPRVDNDAARGTTGEMPALDRPTGDDFIREETAETVPGMRKRPQSDFRTEAVTEPALLRPRAASKPPETAPATVAAPPPPPPTATTPPPSKTTTPPATAHPRSSTVPPISARAKSNTDVGAPAPARAPAKPSIPPPMGRAASSPPLLDPPTPPPPADPTAPAKPSHRLHPRGSTPPTGFFVPPQETADELDRALGEITGERLPPPPSPHDDSSQPEIIIETAPVRAAAVPPPVPGAATSSALSEPEIQIETLEAAADDGNGSHDDDEHEEMTVTIEDESSATEVEVLTDTASQTISITLDETDG